MGHRHIFSKFWPLAIITAYLLFLYGDVIFGNGSLNSLSFAPAGELYQISPYKGWLEHSWLNPLPPGNTNHRAFWDRPQVYDPNIKAGHDLLKRLEFPWLNPYLALGVPLFANGVDSSFFLGNMMMMFLNPVDWDAVYLLLYFLSAVSIYFVFSRGYSLRTSSALLGTMIYVSAGIFSTQLSYGGEIFNIHCFTYALLFVELLRTARTCSAACCWGALVAFFMSQAFYSGMPEGAVACFCMVSLYALVRILQPLESGSYLLKQLSTVKSQLLGAVAIVGMIDLLAVVLAAPYIVSLSYYASTMAVTHEVGGLTLPLHLFPDLFFPYFHGWAITNFFPDLPAHHIQVPFVGLVPLVMLLYLFQGEVRFEKRLIPFVLIILFYSSQAFGTPPFSVNFMKYIPVLRQIFFFRFFAPIFVFATSLICACLFEQFLTRERPVLGLRFLFSTLCLALLYLAYLSSVGLPLKPGSEGYTQFIRHNLPNTVFILLLPLLSLFVSFKHRWTQQVNKVFRSAFLLFFLLHSQSHFAKAFFRKQDPFQTTPGIEFLRSHQLLGEPFRIYSSRIFFPSTSAGYGLEDIRHMNPVVPESSLRVLSSFFGDYAKGQVFWERFEHLNDDHSSIFYEHPAFDLLNVRYFVLTANAPPVPESPNLVEVYRDQQMVIWENKNVLPRYFLLKQWKVIPDALQLLAEVTKRPAELAKQVILQEPPFFDVSNLAPPEANDSFKLISRQNNGYKFETNLGEKNFLVISDAYYRAYRAWINGQRVPVQSANGGLLGVALPPGRYTVELSFWPPFARSALLLGTLAQISLFCFLIINFRRIRSS